MTTRSTKDEEIRALKEELESLRADVAALSGNLKELLESRGVTGQTAPVPESGSEESLDDLEALRRKIAELRESGSAAAEELAREVETHPLLSLGVAFGAGYLLARITGVFR